MAARDLANQELDREITGTQGHKNGLQLYQRTPTHDTNYPLPASKTDGDIGSHSHMHHNENDSNNIYAHRTTWKYGFGNISATTKKPPERERERDPTVVANKNYTKQSPEKNHTTWNFGLN